MTAFIITALKIIFLLGFLITIHELGHFLVAKLCKVKVNEFAIGFGPKIWQKQGKVTKYTLRLIPLGGYNSMEGEEQYSEEEGSFSKASIPKRIAIVLAGGMVNILFGIVTYFILMACVGNNTSLVVDSTMENYAAQTAGVQAGDEIIKVNGKNVHLKTDIDEILEQSGGEEITLTVKRGEEIQEITLTPTAVDAKSTGIYLRGTGAEGEASTKILMIEVGSSAEKAGLKENDEIIKINGTEVKNQEEIIEAITNSELETIEFTVQRGSEILDISLKPDTTPVYYLGIYFKMAENNLGNNLYYAFYQTGDFSFSIIDNLKMLVTGQVRANQLMGPVGISEVVAQTTGIEDFVYLLALISLSLGVTNLLPIPALDGGRIVLLLIEAIRRKRLSEKTEMNIQLIGFAFLITLSIYVAYNDILRIL